MTCVLSFTYLYQNHCSGNTDDKTDLKNENCENYDFNWLTSQRPSSPGVGETEARCATSCGVEASSNSRVDNLSKGFTGHFKQDDSAENTIEDLRDSRQKLEFTNESRTQSPISNGFHDDNSLSLGNRTQTIVSNEPSNSRMLLQGIKRKSEADDIDHIPTKRVSPFLNTPKERKDERKKVLKISLKKLRKLEDPEAFLRRTVLVNNTMKRMQSELREEKYRARKYESNTNGRKYFNGYNVLNNNCLSNSFLYDDPFLCGVNEKITDDMTEILINNVFHDKTSDASAVPETADDSQGKHSSVQCSVSSTTRTCETQSEQSNRCEQSITLDACKECNNVETKWNSSVDSTEPMQVSASHRTSISSCITPHSDVTEFNSDSSTKDLECVKLLTEFATNESIVIHGESNVLSPESHVNKHTVSSCGDLNVDISDMGGIGDNAYEFQTELDLDKKLGPEINEISLL